jgi:hypothetical protein
LTKTIHVKLSLADGYAKQKNIRPRFLDLGLMREGTTYFFANGAAGAVEAAAAFAA